LTEPGDELEGLNDEERAAAEAIRSAQDIAINPAARQVRPARQGLILLYAVSRQSGFALTPGSNRVPLFADPNGDRARDLIGLAISFPRSDQAQEVFGEYVVGTVGWRPME
jgi:hypothetical protein